MVIKKGMTVMLHDGTIADLIGPNNGDGWMANVHWFVPLRRRLQREEISLVRVKRDPSGYSTGSWVKP